VARKGTTIRSPKAARIIFSLPDLEVRNRPATTESMSTRYPPKVFGSPSSPSNGAVTLPPEGIWSTPTTLTTAHVANIAVRKYLMCFLSDMKFAAMK